MSATAGPLSYLDERHQRSHQFLVEEAHLLDELRFEDWLDLVTPDIEYRMPVRVTAMKVASESSVQTMDHFSEDHYSLSKRVQRFSSQYAWAEDPQSRTRHHVTNIRTFTTESTDEFMVDSGVLLFRSRGDINESDLISAGRRDILRVVGSDLRLAHRTITVDEAVLRTQNLALFL